MDYLDSIIFKSVDAVFHVQDIVSCEERKTSPAISSYGDSVQTPGEIIERRRATQTTGHKLNKTPVYPLSPFMCTFDTL